MFKKLEEKLNRLRNSEDIKRIQIKLLEIKMMMPEMKTTLDGINSRLDTVEEKISKLEDKAIGIIQNEKQEKKDRKK